MPTGGKSITGWLGGLGGEPLQVRTELGLKKLKSKKKLHFFFQKYLSTARKYLITVLNYRFQNVLTLKYSKST